VPIRPGGRFVVLAPISPSTPRRVGRTWFSFSTAGIQQFHAHGEFGGTEFQAMAPLREAFHLRSQIGKLTGKFVSIGGQTVGGRIHPGHR